MERQKGRSRSLGLFVLYVSLTFLLFALVSGCIKRQPGEPLSKEDAANEIVSTIVKDIWDKADKRKGLRVNQFQQLLPKGAHVRPAFVSEGKEAAEMVCENSCWLFFVDEDPLAHFAHPVRIVLMDTVTGKHQLIKTDWWPEVDGKPIFSKVKERTDPETVIFDKTPEIKLQGDKQKELLGGISGALKTHDPCGAWAIIVCGYDDLPDTFDEDTDGIYTVLSGLGIPDDHIFFVSPHTTHPGVDQATSIANVQWAINQVAAQADETDKVLFFYSSHGNIDSLSCVPGSPGGGSISASDLDNWLDAITSQELTVVIEACHSGSLIGTYADGTYVAAEDDLRGDGETNRAIFTSASTDTSSYPDIDGADDPNQGDSGSETIWGYVEAFGTAAADSNNDGEISFGEGWQYAWDNDVTRIRGWNTPQMVDSGLVADNVYNYCYRVDGDGDLFVADGPADVGNNSHDYDSTDIWVTQDPAGTDHQDVVSGTINYVHVAVHNRGTTPIANGTLKVYWGDVSTAMSWPDDFHQIGSTSSFGPLGPGETLTHVWTWDVDPAIGLGHHFCLVAVSDSPEDALTGGPPGVTYIAPFDNNVGQKNISIVETSHGSGSLDFVLRNNTRKFDKVDLVIEWVGEPWGSAVLLLPEDLLSLVKRGEIALDNLKMSEIPEQKLPGLAVTGKEGARLKGIPLEPGQSRIVSLLMQTRKTKPGQRSELRLREEADGNIVGAVTARLQQVSPSDCNWVARISIESFADLAAKHEIPSAKQVSQLFAKVLSSRTCCEKKGILDVLTQALKLQKDIANRLPEETNDQAKEKFISRIQELEKNIGIGNIKAALQAQGEVAEAAKDL